jgi:hypothetical protein
LSYISKVEFGVQWPSGLPFASLFSIHLSGIVQGLTQVAAFVSEASLVAVAPMSTVDIPINFAMNVGIALFRATERNTWTATRVGCPDGSLGNVTSLGRTDGGAPMTRFACATPMAFCTAGPLADRSLKSL